MAAHQNDGLSSYDGRDIKGYGGTPPNPIWPKNAKVALNFVINYEEGGEKSLSHGDGESEHLICDIVDGKPYSGQRNMNVESLYDYGSRAGFWRLFQLFQKKKVPATVFAVGMALERNPAVCYELHKSGWEVASHGYRWIDYQNVDEETQRYHIKKTIDIHERLLGKRPIGFYQGKPNLLTRQLVVEEGGFKYDSDSYADDLPYWTMEHGTPHLIIPYTLNENDMRLVSPNNYAHGEQFCNHLKQTLSYLIEEGKAGSPKMMTVGLHCRLARPGMAHGISEFLDYVRLHSRDIWVCTREEIADHWYHHHPPRAQCGSTPSAKLGDTNRESWAGPGGNVSSYEADEEVIDEEDGDII